MAITIYFGAFLGGSGQSGVAFSAGADRQRARAIARALVGLIRSAARS